MPKEVQLAILFADVCGSTKLYEIHGDAKAREAIAKCVALMSESTARQGGTVIKTIGDEVMSTFKTADDAAQAAAEMQEGITEGMSIDGKPLAIRIGFHFGLERVVSVLRLDLEGYERRPILDSGVVPEAGLRALASLTLML